MGNPKPYLSLWRGEIARPRPRRTMCEIAREVCQAHGVTLGELRGRLSARRVSRARQAFMALAYAETPQSLPAIGRWLGGRDHTTVLYGIRAHERRAAVA